MKISLLMKNAPAEVVKIVGLLTRNGYDSISKQFTVANDTASCVFAAIPVGQWHLRVDALDGNDTIRFSGQTDVEVYAGQTTPVSLALDPTTGSINVTVTWGSSTSNHALLFGGNKAVVLFAPSTAFHLQQLTVEMYVQVKNRDTTLVPFLSETDLDEWSYADGFSIKWEHGLLYFRVAVRSTFADYVYVPYSFKKGEWVHLACTYDHTALRIYADGNLIAERPYTVPIYYGQNGFRVGAVSNTYFGGNHYLQGMMDEIRIWNYARSQSEIQQTMKQVLRGDETGLVGYWNCEQHTYGTILSDKTGSLHQGTLSGDVTFAGSKIF